MQIGWTWVKKSHIKKARQTTRRQSCKKNEENALNFCQKSFTY